MIPPENIRTRGKIMREINTHDFARDMETKITEGSDSVEHVLRTLEANNEHFNLCGVTEILLHRLLMTQFDLCSERGQELIQCIERRAEDPGTHGYNRLVGAMLNSNLEDVGFGVNPNCTPGNTS